MYVHLPIASIITFFVLFSWVFFTHHFSSLPCWTPFVCVCVFITTGHDSYWLNKLELIPLCLLSLHVKSVRFFADAMSQARRAGVRVYISASVEEAKNDGLCYIDQMSDFDFPPAHLILRDGSMACTQRRGRFVILYVDRPTQSPIRNCPSHTLYSCWANLELCELEIYGMY